MPINSASRRIFIKSTMARSKSKSSRLALVLCGVRPGRVEEAYPRGENNFAYSAAPASFAILSCDAASSRSDFDSFRSVLATNS